MDDENRQKDMGAYVRRLIELDKGALPPDGGDRFNRLIFSGSPYLLQHAENPVDWYPWGDEAFARARAEDKPVFLSIGYATCHWCHVMAHESFEDRAVAAAMNGNYVAIKVDREERPDIDDQYMTVSRLMTGSGGWPLNVFLTPDKRPFLTVTYLPKQSRAGMPGFIELLENVAALWRDQRDRVEKNCADVMDALRHAVSGISNRGEGADLAGAAFRQLDAMYDPTWGGLGSAPKFPMPGNLSFLLRFWHRSGNPRPSAIVGHTLRMMRQGGIWDQVGGGFHRYSVDREWLVPHFEKMLYDQALVAAAALEAGQATGNAFFATMAQEIFVFVKREMTSPDGGFYAGLDADSEGEEGKYYVWTPAEIREVLGDNDAELFCRLFGVTERGNFEGCSILFLPLPLETFAAREGIVPEILRADLERWRSLLLAAREKRIKPFRDEKIVTAWNGLMIAALAKGYAVTGEERYRTAAEECVRFILERLQTPKGRLLRSSHRGAVSVPAFLEDYAFLVHGLIGLYEATLDQARLDDALRFTLEMLRLFGEKEEGGLYDTGVDAEEVLLRTKGADDGVIPSGNSVAALNLLRLGRITADDGLVREGERILRAFMGSAARQPAGYLYLLSALDYFTAPAVEVTLVGRREDPETTAMLRAIGRRFIPGLVLSFAGEGGKEGLATIEGKTAAYVCAKGACRPPVAGVGELEKLLEEAS